MQNRLWGMKCYVVGAMDRANDGGVEWRDNVTPTLENLGVVVLNPCNKPISIGQEQGEVREVRNKLKENKEYDELSKLIRLIRIVDLRMVDMCDFVIFNLDTTVHTCGSYEEVFWANRMKKPVLLVCKQGKDKVPDWLFGTLPHEHMFNNMDECVEYLCHVAFDENVKHYKRWMFFDYSRMQPDRTEM